MFLHQENNFWDNSDLLSGFGCEIRRFIKRELGQIVLSKFNFIYIFYISSPRDVFLAFLFLVLLFGVWLKNFEIKV